MVWTEIPLDGHTELYVFPRGGIMAARHRSDILEPIVRPHAGAIGCCHLLFHDLPDNARSHTAQVSMAFIDGTCISVMNWLARYHFMSVREKNNTQDGTYYIHQLCNGYIFL